MPRAVSEGGVRIRPVTAGIRFVFVLGSALVTLAGLQLYLGTDHTDRFFAWTIKVPLTAAFLGGFYFTALCLAVLSGLQRVWVRARVGLFGVVLFLWLTLVATLLHLDQFHFDRGASIATVAAWLWLVIYAADPVLATVLSVAQLREPGVDPPRLRRLPTWYRALIGVQGIGILGVGVALFGAPGTSRALWPWPLTPLTAQAIAAWLIGLGVVILSAVVEDDWIRIRPATLAYAALGALQFLALARYPDAFAWGSPQGVVYVVVLASALLVGALGWVASSRAAAAEVRADAGRGTT